MKKNEMASHIAMALFPESYRFESAAVQSEFESLMRHSKSELELLMPGCLKIESKRMK